MADQHDPERSFRVIDMCERQRRPVECHVAFLDQVWKERWSGKLKRVTDRVSVRFLFDNLSCAIDVAL